MARWRAEALHHFPELRQVIVSCDSVMALWIELQRLFEKAYLAQPRNESLIARIYSFADWCVQAPRGSAGAHDPLSAVIVDFYEGIPAFQPARDDMPRWFRYSEVAENRQVFAHAIGDEAFDDLVRFMEKNQCQYQPRGQSTR